MSTTLTKPNTEYLIKKITKGVKQYQNHFNPDFGYELYPLDTPGWKGKISRGVLEFIERTEKLTEDEVIKELSAFKGIGPISAEKIYKNIYRGKIGTRGIDKIKNNFNMDVFPDNTIMGKFIDKIINELGVSLGGETDEPVTSDIKRLIRLPGSLHGKTGLRVVILGLNEFKGFEPLRDAVWEGFADKKVQIEGLVDFEISLRGNSYLIRKNTEIELPGYAALFFACQKKCNIRTN